MCQPADRKLVWQVNLYPGLLIEERAKVQDDLLAKTERRISQSERDAVQDRFGGVLILLNHWSGRKRKPLISALRIGASVPRRTWLYGFPDSLIASRHPSQQQVSRSVIQSIKDALRLWP